jgi:MraZ protein
MFFGPSRHNLDDKGRINFPARFRDVLQKRYDERLIVTLSARGMADLLDRCVHIYPHLEFEKLMERIGAAPASDPAVIAYKLRVVSNAEECRLDKQGRVLIPPRLRDAAGVDKEAMLVGDNNLIQMWSLPEWDKAQDIDRILLESRDRLAQYGL